ncbi:PEGA domain-containing protein [Thermodesulfobacteriota bacterium]
MNRLIEIIGREEALNFDETSLPLLIGMDATAHVRLDGEGGIVAYVAESRNHLFLQPADGTAPGAVYHNDEPVTGSVWLKAGDTTRIGDTLISWHLSGQRVEIHLSKTSAQMLRPPVDPPEKSVVEEQILPVVEVPRTDGHKLRNLVVVLFLLLLTGAAFVLLANPLSVMVTPVPDNLSVSGFPPPLKSGDSYLGISGRYTLHAEKKGYLPLEETIEITGGGSRYSFTMEKLPGLLDLSSTPSGATVLIDGLAIGETPLQSVEIPAGSRRIGFEHERYLPSEATIEIEGFGSKQELHVELEPAWAMVTLRTEPEDAALSVDGEEIGTTPLELALIAGSRELVFSKENFSPLEVALEVVAGEDMTPAVYQLEPAPAKIAITSAPNGATVTIDGGYKGLTPLSIDLSPGDKHVLRLTLPGYQSANRKLLLDPEEERDLNIKLEPEYGTIFITGDPADAILYIDGKKQTLSSGRFRLTTKPHTVEMKAKGYTSASKSVTPQAAYSQRIEIKLQSKQATTTPKAVTAPKAVKTTGLGQKLILIKPKPFIMGASRKEAGRRANESEHKVAMQRHFYLSSHEVTNAEYKLFRAQHSSGMSGNRSLDIDSHPVANVVWEDAAKFMNWLSKKDGLPAFYREENGTMVVADPAGLGYRLPSEAEWAFAARMAGQKERARYPWVGKYPPKTKAGNFADESARHLLPLVIEGYNDGFAASAPTASFSANPAGIHDLGGNVAEWCHDYYSAFNGNADKNAVDPMGPTSGAHRVVRGSSWRNASITELRFSYRRYSREAANDIGFRIARYAK